MTKSFVGGPLELGGSAVPVIFHRQAPPVALTAVMTAFCTVFSLDGRNRTTIFPFSNGFIVSVFDAGDTMEKFNSLLLPSSTSMT